MPTPRKKKPKIDPRIHGFDPADTLTPEIVYDKAKRVNLSEQGQSSFIATILNDNLYNEEQVRKFANLINSESNTQVKKKLKRISGYKNISKDIGAMLKDFID